MFANSAEFEIGGDNSFPNFFQKHSCSPSDGKVRKNAANQHRQGARVFALHFH